jgi:two-component system response regulator YesN
MIEEGLELPQSVGNYIVDAAIEFIRTSYAKQIGLQETAEYLNISESHLCRLFKEYTQINFLQYISAWRINKAIELMEKSFVKHSSDCFKLRISQSRLLCKNI